VDLLIHPEVQRILGRAKLEGAVLNALRIARMRVLPHHLDWVVSLIGAEEAVQCASLRRALLASRRDRRTQIP
jgi:hypothetical protein